MKTQMKGTLIQIHSYKLQINYTSIALDMNGEKIKYALSQSYYKTSKTKYLTVYVRPCAHNKFLHWKNPSCICSRDPPGFLPKILAPFHLQTASISDMSLMFFSALQIHKAVLEISVPYKLPRSVLS